MFVVVGSVEGRGVGGEKSSGRQGSVVEIAKTRSQGGEKCNEVVE